MIKKILIANRGEIAVRIIKACREMRIISAVIYSEADINSLHTRIADEAYLVGPAPASQSYLNIPKIIEIAKSINADAIHPGYGFLAENYNFIRELNKNKIIFIGPSSRSVEMMGHKTKARELMNKHGVPIVPGSLKPIMTLASAKKIALRIDYPVMLKASAGGGGKGMRLIENESELKEGMDRAQNESLKAFGNKEIYIEKYIEQPKHIEVQIIADQFGNYRHLFERECSIQRRHQKIIEESPSPSIDEDTRTRITGAAIDAAKACGYYNAGTVEFLMDRTGNFFFLEMNTRLQVEHPVTEMISGIDLVKEQIRIANGDKVSFSQEEIKINGHAVECRVCAEDTTNNFAPSTGRILHHRLPSGPGIRIDRGVDLLSEISVNYDSLMSKLIAWGSDRVESIRRMHRALGEYQIAGVTTNIPLCKWILKHDKFIKGSFTTNFINEEISKVNCKKLYENGSSEYEEVSAIIATLLKASNLRIRAHTNSVSKNNMWNYSDE